MLTLTFIACEIACPAQCIDTRIQSAIMVCVAIMADVACLVPFIACL